MGLLSPYSPFGAGGLKTPEDLARPLRPSSGLGLDKLDEEVYVMYASHEEVRTMSSIHLPSIPFAFSLHFLLLMFCLRVLLRDLLSSFIPSSSSTSPRVRPAHVARVQSPSKLPSPSSRFRSPLESSHRAPGLRNTRPTDNVVFVCSSGGVIPSYSADL